MVNFLCNHHIEISEEALGRFTAKGLVRPSGISNQLPFLLNVEYSSFLHTIVLAHYDDGALVFNIGRITLNLICLLVMMAYTTFLAVTVLSIYLVVFTYSISFIVQ